MSDQCVKGVNWGEVTLDDKNLTLKHNKLNLLKIPMKKIVNSITQKNDIVIQLNTEDNDQNDDMLCEIRFYVPPSTTEKQETKKKNEGDAIQEESEEENNTNFQQQLHNDILNKAKIGQSSADSIVSISDVPLIVPRGKYNVDLFRYSVRFHGSTYQFTTEYKSISKMFMLPMQDEVHMAFVIGLDKPLKQGQTTYHYIMMQFKKEQESEVKLKYTKEQLDEIGWSNIKQEYAGPLYDIVCNLLSEITGVRVVIPKNFKSKNGSHSLRCSVGPHQGFLFPLDRSLIYISKPVIQISHEDFKEVIFQRISQSNLNKLFDMKIVSKTTKAVPQLFAGIDRGELEILSEYFQSKKIKVQRIQEDVHHKIQMEDSDDDDDIDDDDSRDRKRNKKVLTKQNQALGNMDSDEDDEDFEIKSGQEPASDDISEVSDEEQSRRKK